jgi:protein kinase-like protein
LEATIVLAAWAPTYINGTLLMADQRHKRLFDGDVIAVHPEIRFEYARPGWRRLRPEFRDKYSLFRQLATHAYWSKYLCRERSTEHYYAVKILRKEGESGSNVDMAIEREIQIVRATRHSNIVELKDVFETPNETFLVLEYPQCGDLSLHVAEHVEVPEDIARKVFGQLFGAVKYLVSSIPHVPGFDLRPGLTQTEKPARERHHSPRHHA